MTTVEPAAISANSLPKPTKYQTTKAGSPEAMATKRCYLRLIADW